jgi:hypothetical protein
MFERRERSQDIDIARVADCARRAPSIATIRISVIAPRLLESSGVEIDSRRGLEAWFRDPKKCLRFSEEWRVTAA